MRRKYKSRILLCILLLVFWKALGSKRLLYIYIQKRRRNSVLCTAFVWRVYTQCIPNHLLMIGRRRRRCLFDSVTTNNIYVYNVYVGRESGAYTTTTTTTTPKAIGNARAFNDYLRLSSNCMRNKSLWLYTHTLVRRGFGEWGLFSGHVDCCVCVCVEYGNFWIWSACATFRRCAHREINMGKTG